MIRLEQLSISAFRGIPGHLNLNLEAPLNLIFAPNGTGKTSICDAVEWVLTGAIKRLDPASADDPLRCRFSPETTQTVVSATIKIGDDRLRIERTPKQCRWAAGNEPL